MSIFTYLNIPSHTSVKDGQEAYFDRKIGLDDVARSGQRGVSF